MEYVFGIGGLVLGILGVIPTYILLRETLHLRRPVRRMLGFKTNNGVEVVITTSHTGVSSVGPKDGPRALRSLIPAGDLAGVADLTAALGKVYPTSRIHMVPSEQKNKNLHGDVLVVGGPVHNSWARSTIVGELGDAQEGDQLVLDANARYIRLGDQEWGPGLDLHFHQRVPTLDYAMIVLTTAHRMGKDCRVVLVAGLTTYGTHAGCRYLAYDAAHDPVVADLGRAPNIAMVVQASFVNGEPQNIKRIAHLAL